MESSNRAQGLGPPARALGPTTRIPPLLVGREPLDPGPWAERLDSLPWLCVKEGRFIKSDLIKKIRHIPPQREPMVRHGLDWTGENLNSYLDGSIRRVEAFYIFMVGRVSTMECENCQRERGVFPVCVVIDVPGGAQLCAGCHYDGHDCSLFSRSHHNTSTTRQNRVRGVQAPSATPLPTSVQAAIREGRNALNDLDPALNSLNAQISRIEQTASPSYDRVGNFRLPTEQQRTLHQQAIWTLSANMTTLNARIQTMTQSLSEIISYVEENH